MSLVELFTGNVSSNNAGPMSVADLIDAGLPVAEGTAVPDENTNIFSGWYTRAVACDATNLNIDGVKDCAHAIRYVLPHDLENVATKNQVRDAISILERWLQLQNTQRRFFSSFSRDKEFVINSLAKWYSHPYEIRGTPIINDRLNYAPHSDTVDRLDGAEMALHQCFRRENGSDAQKVQAIIDLKNTYSLIASPR